MRNDVNIYKREKIFDIYGNEVAWAEKIDYNMPALDKAGKPIGNGNYSVTPQSKILFDPELMSSQEYCRRGVEAANSALLKESSGGLPHEWVGGDSEGVKWVGYFENGKITSFYLTN